MLSRFSTVRGIGLDFLTLKQNAVINGMIPVTSEMIEIGINRFLDTLKICNVSRKHKINFREADMLFKSTSFQRSAFCHACKGQSLAVYPDGTVYPCSQLAGEKAFCAGNVIDSIDFSRLCLQEAELKNNNCLSCVLNARCPGDCPSRFLFNGKDVSENICKLYQIIYRYQRGNLRMKTFTFCYFSSSGLELPSLGMAVTSYRQSGKNIKIIARTSTQLLITLA